MQQKIAGNNLSDIRRERGLPSIFLTTLACKTTGEQGALPSKPRERDEAENLLKP